VLAGDAERPAPELPPQAILIADEILPSDLVGLDPAKLAGIAMARGGPTSHVAILAAGMGIPALVAAGSAILDVPDEADVLLDADAGVLHLRPDAALIEKARALAATVVRRKREAQTLAALECRTADGTRVEIFANLGKGAAEAAEAVALGAEGCGVLRTEFLFMDRPAPPTKRSKLPPIRRSRRRWAAGPSYFAPTILAATSRCPIFRFRRRTIPRSASAASAAASSGPI